MYQFEDGKSVFILIWNICISKPAAIYQFFLKNVLYVSSSGLFLSWEWEWSSWDPSSFSPSSLCETRRKWTPYSTVQHTLQHRSVNCRRSLVYFTVPPLRLSSVCGVFFHLPGGTDERFGAGRVHLRLHGLLREEGERRTCTKPSPPPSRLNILNSSCAVSLSLQGEPHMSTAYAVMMSYWEGVLHYLLFLIIIHRMFKG